MNCELVILGSGNLATQLSMALKSAGWSVRQVYSPTMEHAQELAEKLDCKYTSDISGKYANADAYIVSVKDDAVESVAARLKDHINPNATIIHTAGSVPMKALHNHFCNCGVLYPMQSFSKSRKVNFKEIHCFLEASCNKAMTLIRQLAESISDNIHCADSETRKRIHLAAVLASNLANHCYRLGERVLEETGIDFNILLPLIQETARKVTEMSPREAQTGPMVRYDTGVMSRQIELLHDERTRQIYRLMAESIHDDNNNKKTKNEFKESTTLLRHSSNYSLVSTDCDNPRR